jgi:hypothetical protein
MSFGKKKKKKVLCCRRRFLYTPESTPIFEGKKKKKEEIPPFDWKLLARPLLLLSIDPSTIEDVRLIRFQQSAPTKSSLPSLWK